MTTKQSRKNDILNTFIGGGAILGPFRPNNQILLNIEEKKYSIQYIRYDELSVYILIKNTRQLNM